MSLTEIRVGSNNNKEVFEQSKRYQVLFTRNWFNINYSCLAITHPWLLEIL